LLRKNYKDAKNSKMSSEEMLATAKTAGTPCNRRYADQKGMPTTIVETTEQKRCQQDPSNSRNGIKKQ
jgi:hypothetical protein